MIHDILGTPVELESAVIACHNNRIIVGKVIKINEQTHNVTVEPLPFDSGERRPPPDMKPFIRTSYNVFVVNDQELFMGTLKGYCHNSGLWDEAEDDFEEDSTILPYIPPQPKKKK